MTIENEIQSLQLHIRNYRKVLNDESVWLFLTTLGCWSVSQVALQYIALGFTLLIFGDRTAKRQWDKRSFAKIVVDIENRISALPPGDTQKARLYDLATVQKNEFKGLKAFKETWKFFLSWSFWVATLTYIASLSNH